MGYWRWIWESIKSPQIDWKFILYLVGFMGFASSLLVFFVSLPVAGLKWWPCIALATISLNVGLYGWYREFEK